MISHLYFAFFYVSPKSNLSHYNNIIQEETKAQQAVKEKLACEIEDLKKQAEVI